MYYCSSSIQGFAKGNVKRIGVSSQQEELWGDDENLVFPQTGSLRQENTLAEPASSVLRGKRSFSLPPFYFIFFLIIYFIYSFIFSPPASKT